MHNRCRHNNFLSRPVFYFTPFVAVICLFVVSCATSGYKASDGGYLTASWYGPGFHGKPTASGERYDQNGLTCAHKSLPFGTRLRVTNMLNGKSVDVVVNDRGPFIVGRDLDLSYGAAKEIGMVGPGTAKVRADHLGRDMRYAKRVAFGPSQTGPFTIQAGAFVEEDNALRLKAALELNYKGVYITTAELEGNVFYRVRIGKFRTKDDAYRNAKVLAEEGYGTLVTRYDEPKDSI